MKLNSEGDNEDEDDEDDEDEDDEEEVSVLCPDIFMFLGNSANHVDRVDHENEHVEIQEINISMWKLK